MSLSGGGSSISRAYEDWRVSKKDTKNTEIQNGTEEEMGHPHLKGKMWNGAQDITKSGR